MISKAKACPGGTALFLYIMKENKGYELFRNKLFGNTPKEISTEMSIIQKQNLRCRNNPISIVISPAIKDSSKMTDMQLQSFTEKVLQELKLEPKKLQLLLYVHTERKHKHLHCLINRVYQDGTLINDHRISNRTQRAAHIVAKEYGLISAKDIKEAKENKRKIENKKIIEEIKKACYYVLKRHPRNLNEFQREMAKFKIEVKPTINKQGNIQGFRFIHLKTGINLKASEVDRKIKIHKLFIQENSLKRQNTKEELSLKQFKLNISILSSILSHLDYYFERDPKKNRKRDINR